MIVWTPGNTLADVEKHVILKALQFYQGNKTQTARALGIALRTLANKLDLYSGVISSLPPDDVTQDPPKAIQPVTQASVTPKPQQHRRK